MVRSDKTFALFHIEDYNDQDKLSYCSIKFLNLAEVSLLMSCLRYANYFSSRWVNSSGDLLEGQDLEWANAFVSRLERMLLMNCDVQPLFDSLERIADASEANGSILSDIGQAISGLSLSPTINLEPVVEVQAFCSSCCGASEFDEPIDPTDTTPEQPPKGWEEKTYPDIPVSEYRCRASNYVIDYVDQALQQFIIEDVAGTIAFGVAVTLGVIVTVYNFLLASLGMAALMTAGDLLLLAKAIILYELDLVALRDMIANNRDDLVCAYYEGGTQQAQQDKANEILDLAGATEAQITLFNLIVPTKLTTFFFYTLPSALGAKLDRDIESHPLTSDCTGCVLVCDEYLLFGTEQARGTHTIDFSSADPSATCPSWVATQRVVYYTTTQAPSDPCDSGGFISCPPGLTVTGVEVISGSIVQSSNSKLRLTNFNGQKVVSTNSLPWVGSEPGITVISLLGQVGTPYTIRVTFEEVL